MAEIKTVLTENEINEVLDWASACQSAYHIDSTPNHRFGGVGSNLAENRSGLIECINSILSERAIEAAVLSALTPPTWRCCEKMVEQGAGNMVCCGEPIEVALLSANAGKVDEDQENNDGGGAFNPDWLGRRNGWNDALDSAIEILHQLNDQSEVGDYFDMAIASIISLKSSTTQQASDAGRQG